MGKVSTFLHAKWGHRFLSGMLGVAMAMGLPPYGMWWLAVPALICAFFLFQHQNVTRDAFITGWSIGFGYFCLALSWIVEPFFVDAAATGWMAPFALFFMAGGLALFWGGAFWAAGRFRPEGVWQLAVFWSLAELLRGYVLTGFPWAMLAYIWAPLDVIQWVSVFGSYGLTLVSCLTGAAIVQCFIPSRRRLAIPTAFALITALFVGGAALRPAPQETTGRPVVRLVQPNAAQHEKWHPDLIPVFFQRQVAFTGEEWQLDAPPSLIVWPETALPMLLGQADEAFDIISQAAGSASVVVGLQREEEGQYFNSLAVLDAQGAVSDVYDKHHLVPFGEYMPAASIFEKLDIFGLAARASSAYTPGQGPDMLDLGGLGRALALICYEAVFPQDVHTGSDRPDFMLQLTNDAWFGNGAGPLQHLDQARIRAVEQGVPLIRSANTGISAVIDGSGRITAQIGLNEAGFLDAPLPSPSRVTLYSRTGDWPIIALILAFGLFTSWKELRHTPLTGKATTRNRG